ncbi:MAG: phage protease [Candidatus Magnetominusculus sp. LBB02]|nr:phage protease [Candidatus Magnetominusculus sp. LBB02]
MTEKTIKLVNTIDGAVPSEIQIIPYGYHETDNGAFVLDEESMSAIIGDFKSRQNDMVIDYEHQTLAGTEAPAAGWIKDLIDKGTQGLWASVEWTEKARQYIAAKEYRYLSPVFIMRISDSKVVKLINAALTNQPGIDGMVPLVNKRVSGITEAQTKEEGQVIKVLAALGLAGDATEADVLKAIDALKAKTQKTANKAVLDAIGLNEDAGESEVTGTIMAMKQAQDGYETIANKVRELEGKLAAKEADDLVALAMKDGKITPAQLDWATNYAKTDAAGFRVFVEKAPAVVVTKEIAGGEKAGGTGDALDETQRSVNKQLGIDDAKFREFSAQAKTGEDK